MLPPILKRLLGMDGGKADGSTGDEPKAIVLHGRADFPIDVIGVSRFRSQLLDLLDGMPQPGQRKECVAALIIEDGAASDRAAVAVVINGKTVGSSPAYLTTQYLEWLSRWRLSSAPARCNAVIVVSNERNQDGNFGLGVKLDIELPFKMTTYY